LVSEGINGSEKISAGSVTEFLEGKRGTASLAKDPVFESYKVCPIV
jgi:hypothetical protein